MDGCKVRMSNLSSNSSWCSKSVNVLCCFLLLFGICKCTMLLFTFLYWLFVSSKKKNSGKFASLLITLRFTCLWSRFLWIWIVQRLLRIFIYFIDFNSSPVSNEPMLLTSTVFSTPPRKKRRSSKKKENCFICSHFTNTKSFISFTYTVT